MENLIIEIVNTLMSTDIKKYSISREKRHIHARSLYYKLLRDLAGYSLQKIGLVCNKTHVSIINSLKKYEYVYTIDNIDLPIKYKEARLAIENSEAYKERENVKKSNRILSEEIRDLKVKIIELSNKKTNLEEIANTKDSSIDADLLKAVKLIPESQLINAIPRITAMAKMMQSAKYN